MIQKYFDQLNQIRDNYLLKDFVSQAEVNSSSQPEGQGYLYGTIIFQDGTVLYFREYLSSNRKELQKVSYIYEYQNMDATLIFRYDNAMHHPPLGFSEHIHTPDGITVASAPSLEEVLAKIATSKGWVL